MWLIALLPLAFANPPAHASNGQAQVAQHAPTQGAARGNQDRDGHAHTRGRGHSEHGQGRGLGHRDCDGHQADRQGGDRAGNGRGERPHGDQTGNGRSERPRGDVQIDPKTRR